MVARVRGSSQDHRQRIVPARRPPGWAPLPATVVDHARALGLSLTDIGLLSSIRTLQEVQGYTHLHLSQIVALCPLDSPSTVIGSITHLQRLGLLIVTRSPSDHCRYDLSPLYQRCAAFISEQEETLGQGLLAAYVEAGEPFGPTLEGLCTWAVRRQHEASRRADSKQMYSASGSGAAARTRYRCSSEQGSDPLEFHELVCGASHQHTAQEESPPQT